MGFENNTGIGSLSHYGPRSTNQKYGGVWGSQDGVKEAVYVFDFDDLPAQSSSNIEVVIPSGATIVGAKFRVITGFTSTSTTSDLTVGLADSDGGSDITDADGIFTAAELTQTVIATAGNYVAGSGGALIGVTLSEAAELTVAPTVDDLLTGRAEVTVEYKLATPSQAS